MDWKSVLAPRGLRRHDDDSPDMFADENVTSGDEIHRPRAHESRRVTAATATATVAATDIEKKDDQRAVSMEREELQQRRERGRIEKRPTNFSKIIDETSDEEDADRTLSSDKRTTKYVERDDDDDDDDDDDNDQTRSLSKCPRYANRDAVASTTVNMYDAFSSHAPVAAKRSVPLDNKNDEGKGRTMTMTTTQDNKRARVNALAVVEDDCRSIARESSAFAIDEIWDDVFAQRRASGVVKLHAPKSIRICSTFDDAAAKSCWSLLRDLDVDKCLSEMGLLPESADGANNRAILPERRAMTELLIELRARVNKIARIADAQRLNARVCLPKEDDESIRGGSHEGCMFQLDEVLDADDVLASIRELDERVHALLVCILQRRIDRTAAFLREGNFATLNCVLHQEHLDYLTDKIRLVREEDRDRRLSGYFLVSAERSQRAKLKFPCLEDRSKCVSRVLAEYVRTQLLGVDSLNVPVYVNVSEKRDVERLNVLSSGDPSHELALFEIARASLDSTKRCINIKAFASVILCGKK